MKRWHLQDEFRFGGPSAVETQATEEFVGGEDNEVLEDWDFFFQWKMP